MLILKIVALGPVHGYAISQRIRQISKDVLQVQQGSLYPALQRLEKRAWLEAEWGASENGRQAKFYLGIIPQTLLSLAATTISGR